MEFGYVACPNSALAKAMSKLQGQVTSNVNSMTQYTAIVALEGYANKDIEMMRVEFEKEKDYAVKAINNISKLSCYDPDGYFLSIYKYKKYSNDSMKFCADLLEKKSCTCSWSCFWDGRIC